MDWCLDLCYLLFGGLDFGFIYIFFLAGGGVAFFGILRGSKFFLNFFPIFLKLFKKIFFYFLFNFFSVLWRNFINICSTFTHSFTQFFSCVGGKCKCWTMCFFFVLGQQQLNNCFWKIREALRRAGFGATCVG